MARDIDDEIKDVKVSRHFPNHIDPTHQTPFCKRCARPVLHYEERLDSANNIEEIFEDYCPRCWHELRRVDLNG